MYTVERILQKKIDKKSGKPMYLIKWEGYLQCESTWEPLNHLEKCQELIQQFQISREQTLSREKSKLFQQKKIRKSKQISCQTNNHNLEIYHDPLHYDLSRKGSIGNDSNLPLKRDERFQEQNEVTNKKETQKNHMFSNTKKKKISYMQKRSKRRIHLIKSEDRQDEEVQKGGISQIKKQKSSLDFGIQGDFQILGLRPKSEGGNEFLLKIDGVKVWKDHEYLFNNHSKELCKFYEKYLVLDNGEDQ